MQKSEGQYPRQSSAERKEALYQDIIDYFDKGKVCIHGGSLYNMHFDKHSVYLAFTIKSG